MGWALMCSPMMNSMRARPIPAAGSRHHFSAAPGLARLTIRLVLVAGRSSSASSCVVILAGPSKTRPTSPPAHDTVTRCPSARVEVASTVPTTAGTPSSRLTIAAWEVRPPRLVTTAAARCITGTQSGSVASATRIDPDTNRSPSSGESRRHTSPVAAPLPTDRPSTNCGPWFETS